MLRRPNVGLGLCHPRTPIGSPLWVIWVPDSSMFQFQLHICLFCRSWLSCVSVSTKQRSRAVSICDRQTLVLLLIPGWDLFCVSEAQCRPALMQPYAIITVLSKVSIHAVHQSNPRVRPQSVHCPQTTHSSPATNIPSRRPSGIRIRRKQKLLYYSWGFYCINFRTATNA